MPEYPCLSYNLADITAKEAKKKGEIFYNIWKGFKAKSKKKAKVKEAS